MSSKALGKKLIHFRPIHSRDYNNMLARGVSQEGTQPAQIPLHTPQPNRLLLLPSVSKQHTVEDLGQQQELSAGIKPLYY